GDNVTLQATGLAEPSGMFGDLCLPNKTALLTPETAGEIVPSPVEPVRGLPKNIVNASLAMIFFGMMLQGFGKSPRYSFTVTYIDNNTGRTNTGFYMGE
ncbi:solute carrier organic anion transporter family member, partial [Elysia marginata]